MRAIRNPFQFTETNSCFACSADHPFGLHMKFFEDGDEVGCQWHPQRGFCGYGDVLHGGIQATLMDEIAAWAIFVKCKTAGVTSRMEIQYERPVRISKGSISVRASTPEVNGHVAVVPVRLLDAENEVCTRAQAHYTIFSEKVARKRLGYPGHEAFFA